MSRSLLHEWESDIERICGDKADEMLEIAKNIYDTGFARGKNKGTNKGEWITDKERLGYWLSTCSKCEHIFHGDELLIYKPNFCPNCGADMRGDSE